jgi:hypothetical protein
VTLRVDGELPAAAAAFAGNGSRIERDPGEPRVLRARVRDVAAELPVLLDRVRQTGRAVEDIDVRGPSLQAVFIHLTGRELRE